MAPIVKIRAPSDQAGPAPAAGPRPLGHSLCRCIRDVHAALRLRTDGQTVRPTDRAGAESADSTCLSRGMRGRIIRPFISWTAHALCRCPFRRENKGIDKGVGKVQEGCNCHPSSTRNSIIPVLFLHLTPPPPPPPNFSLSPPPPHCSFSSISVLCILPLLLLFTPRSLLLLLLIPPCPDSSSF